MDGRLVRDHGASLDEALEAFSRAILHARHQGAGCTEAGNQARSAINHVHSSGLPPGNGATPSHDPAAEPAPAAALRQAEPRARHPKNGRPRARWFGGPRNSRAVRPTKVRFPSRGRTFRVEGARSVTVLISARDGQTMITKVRS